MGKVVGNKEISISDVEFKYYNELIVSFTDKTISGKSYFDDLFESDKSGFITMVRTDKSVPWAILFFIQQVMINQRLRVSDKNDIILSKLTSRIENLEAIIVNMSNSKK